MPANEDLTTLDAAKISAGETGDADDVELTRLLNSVEAAVAVFCRRNFYKAGTNAMTSFSNVEYFSGDGQRELWLPRFPVTAIAELKVDNNGHFGHGASSFGTDSAWTIGEDFTPNFDYADLSNIGELVSLVAQDRGLFGPCWPDGTGNIKITYTAGYATIPDDLVHAVHLLFSEGVKRFGNENGPMMKSERQGRYAYELLTQGTSTQILNARTLLMPYRDKS